MVVGSLGVEEGVGEDLLRPIHRMVSAVFELFSPAEKEQILVRPRKILPVIPAKITRYFRYCISSTLFEGSMIRFVISRVCQALRSIVSIY